MDLDGDEQSRAARATETKELLVGSALCFALLGLAGLWLGFGRLAGLGESKKEAPASPRQGQGRGKVAGWWCADPGKRQAGDPEDGQMGGIGDVQKSKSFG